MGDILLDVSLTLELHIFFLRVSHEMPPSKTDSGYFKGQFSTQFRYVGIVLQNLPPIRNGLIYLYAKI